MSQSHRVACHAIQCTADTVFVSMGHLVPNSICAREVL